MFVLHALFLDQLWIQSSESCCEDFFASALLVPFSRVCLLYVHLGSSCRCCGSEMLICNFGLHQASPEGYAHRGIHVLALATLVFPAAERRLFLSVRSRVCLEGPLYYKKLLPQNNRVIWT